MTDKPHLTMTSEELAIELLTSSQVLTSRAEAERLLKQIKDRHAHELAEQIRTAWNAHDPKKPGNVTMLSALNAANHIDPEVKR